MFIGFSTPRIEKTSKRVDSEKSPFLGHVGNLQSPSRAHYDAFQMKVHLTNPHKDLEVQGPTRVRDLLLLLNLVPEAYLVIRGR